MSAGRGVCLITGGSSGIGAATAELAAQAGYSVAIASLPEHRLDAQTLVTRLRTGDGHAAQFSVDVGDPQQVEQLFNHVETELGTISAVVNAAGVPLKSRVDELDTADVDRVFAVNVVGMIVSCREAVRRMTTARGGSGGSIVNVSSMAVTIAGRPGSSVYAASKAAVDVFSAALAKEVAREGVRVNVVRPGLVRSAMTRFVSEDPALEARVAESIAIGRLGEPIEVARAIVWLLSPDAGFVTGAHLDAAGGGYLVASNTPQQPRT